MSFKPYLLGSTLILAVALASGCGKKTDTETATPPAVPTNSAEPATAPPVANPTPNNNTAGQPSPEAAVSQRSIDYLQGLVLRKQYDQARKVLATLESQSLTPEQQQTVQKLKSQIPPQ